MQTVQKWNEESADYQRVFKLGMNDYNRGLIQFLLDNRMLWGGCRVIDVGCGVGKYGTYFATMGCDVTLTDISDGMIEMAKKNMSDFDTPWTTLVCDFHTVEQEHPIFKKDFDLAISTMSPAIHDLDTVNKISGMTDGWVFLSHFIAWDEPLRKKFYEKLGVFPEGGMGEFEGHIEKVTQAIKDAGYEPLTKTVPYNWSDDRTAEEAAAYLLRRIDQQLVTEELKVKALDVAKELCNDDGIFVDAVNTDVAWVYWNTKGV